MNDIGAQMVKQLQKICVLVGWLNWGMNVLSSQHITFKTVAT
jgi:hypothetical protein